MTAALSLGPLDALPLGACSAARIGGGEPDITVVIPVYNNWAVTQRCLRALFACDSEVAIEVIVVDDASSDETPAALALLPGIRVVRNGVNCGFVHSCNLGAAQARGRFILFLNNDTQVTYGALRTLVRRIESDDRIGIVGSKLIYPDGRLQEAGNIVWSDASGWNYGRLDAPEKAEYNFFRDVDYVSAASLLIRSSEFRAIGGFDARYAPGYYEDADLCFAVRERGKRVVYEPASLVVHHEGVTSGTDETAGMKRFQAINRTKFAAKWEAVLRADHLASHRKNVYRAARRRGRAEASLLVIDSYVPLYDKEAGSNRLKHLVDGFRNAGLRIVYLPDNLTKMPPYTEQLERAGIEVVYFAEAHRRPWRESLAELLPTIDAVWVCRPDLCAKYLPTIRELSRVPIIYDMIDLHFLRLRRQAEAEARRDDAAWRASERLELACANAAERTIVVSDYEAELLGAAGIPNVGIIPTVHDMEKSGTLGYARTHGIAFIGGYNHIPNVDAVTWLIREIMPEVWLHLPDVTVTLMGSNPPAAVQALAGERVVVTGYVSDARAAETFRSTRVFVAPLRFGAGLKGKIGQALAFATPIVSTGIGIEGFPLCDERDVLVANDAQSFAAAIVRLYGDSELWERLSAASGTALAPFASTTVVANALRIVRRVIGDRQQPEPAAPSDADADADGGDGAESTQLRALRAELRVVRKREAELYLSHLQTIEDLRDTRDHLKHARAHVAALADRCERLDLEVERRERESADLRIAGRRFLSAALPVIERAPGGGSLVGGGRKAFRALRASRRKPRS
jgi:GT2 family glycosyltransferase